MARVPEIFPIKDVKWTLAIKEIFVEKRSIHLRAIRYNFTSEVLKISVESRDSKPNWYSAGYLSQIAQGIVIGSDHSYQIPLNKDYLLVLPEVAPIYNLTFNIHHWIKNATLTIHQGVLQP